MSDIIAKAQERGEFVTGDDGFVYYWPKGTGAYQSHILRALADELDKRNAAWQAGVDEYFAALNKGGGDE